MRLPLFETGFFRLELLEAAEKLYRLILSELDKLDIGPRRLSLLHHELTTPPRTPEDVARLDIGQPAFQDTVQVYRHFASNWNARRVDPEDSAKEQNNKRLQAVLWAINVYCRLQQVRKDAVSR